MHTARYVGLEANAGLFAIVANVDTYGELLLNHPAYGRLYVPLELCYINALTALMTDEQIAQHGRAWQTSHMGGQNTIMTPVHDSSSCSPSYFLHIRSVAYIVLDKRYRIQ